MQNLISNFTFKDFLLIVLILSAAAMFVLIILKDNKIAELQLKNGAYDSRINKIQTSLDILKTKESLITKRANKLQQEKDSLIDELENIPTDVEVIYKSNINFLNANASWQRIDSAIYLAFEDSIPE